MESKSIQLSVKSHPKNLAQIREAVSKTASKAGLSEEVSGSIILAVDEACSNIIRHSYDNDHTREIDLTLEVSAKELIITLVDKGIEFNICETEARDVSEVRPGGLGIYIIKEVMDHVDYCRTTDGCNCVKLVKKL